MVALHFVFLPFPSLLTSLLLKVLLSTANIFFTLRVLSRAVVLCEKLPLSGVIFRVEHTAVITSSYS